jgi:predicted aldo/keto reductase-like oxidoreductase
MNYRQDKYGNPLSVLGFGCLRFPQKKGRIDMEETEKEIKLAIEQGINYFDTAYIYSGSEAALGEILEKHGIREKVRIATKLPHYLIKNLDTLERLAEMRESLRIFPGHGGSSTLACEQQTNPYLKGFFL